MKNTFNNIIAKVASISAALLFGTMAFAQDGAVHYDKKVTSEPDANGIYTVSLEAYVTGSVTVTTETKPADIVLVLDYSSSMRDDIDNLKSAVAGFVSNIKESNKTVVPDKNGGHRIALVLFAGQVFTGSITWGRSDANPGTVNYSSNLNTFLNVESSALNNIGTGGSGDLINYEIHSGTNSPDAMEAAKNVLATAAGRGDYTDVTEEQEDGTSVTYKNSERSRIVVFFTDGEPYIGSTNRKPAMDSTIVRSNRIKNSTTYKGTVYTVGLFTGHNSADQVTTYMSYTSSDYTNQTGVPASNSGGPWVNVSGKYSIIVSNSSALANIFDSIASSAGGDYSASSSSSIMIDVVATSFAIPTDADLGSVKVYQQKCKKPTADAILDFYPDKVAVPDSVANSLTVNPTTGEVTVTKFDYGANWCGYDAEHNTEHGYKLVLEIPIKAKADAVGGPHVNTNTADSKLIIKDKDGNVLSENIFPRPFVKLPVQIWIQKTGLSEDDSAVFNLRRTPYVGANVDYSASTVKWESWGEKIVCNKETMDADGCVKVTGLSPDYVYKVYEDAWGSLGYVYQDDDVLYTFGDNVMNPFKFVNTPKNVVFDEAQVRNVFKKKEKETSSDSK